MKKTSYFIIGLIIAILVLLTALTIIKIRSISATDISSGPVSFPIPADTPIENLECSITPAQHLFNGIKIEMSDSVNEPVITVDSLLRRFLSTKILDNTLYIGLVVETPKSTVNDIGRQLIIHNGQPYPIQLTLPRNPLRRLTSTFGRIELIGLDTRRLTMYSNDRINVTDCNIDTLILTAGGYAKALFRDSSVEYMRLKMEDNYIKIDCCDSTSIIRKVDFTACEGVKNDVYLNEANIDTLRWVQDNPTQLTVRIKHPINIVK